MKLTKYVTAAAALIGSICVFTDWVSVGGKSALGKTIAQALPMSGMQNGGAVLLFLFGVVLVLAVVGVAKRYGRGLAIPSLLCGLVLTFFAMAKYSDIAGAQEKLGQLAKGLTISPTITLGMVLFAAVLTLLAPAVAVIKPEKAPA